MELIAWIMVAFLLLILIGTIMKRRQEKEITDAVLESAEMRIHDFQTELLTVRQEKCDALAKGLRAEIVIGIIKNSLVRDDSFRRWYLPDDRLAFNDKSGEVTEILRWVTERK